MRTQSGLAYSECRLGGPDPGALLHGPPDKATDVQIGRIERIGQLLCHIEGHQRGIADRSPEGEQALVVVTPGPSHRHPLRLQLQLRCKEIRPSDRHEFEPCSGRLDIPLPSGQKFHFDPQPGLLSLGDEKLPLHLGQDGVEFPFRGPAVDARLGTGLPNSVKAAPSTEENDTRRDPLIRARRGGDPAVLVLDDVAEEVHSRPFPPETLARTVAHIEVWQKCSQGLTFRGAHQVHPVEGLPVLGVVLGRATESVAQAEDRDFATLLQAHTLRGNGTHAREREEERQRGPTLHRDHGRTCRYGHRSHRVGLPPAAVGFSTSSTAASCGR